MSNSHRNVDGLASARLLPSRPGFIPVVKRLRGTKALGVGFERKVAAALPFAKAGRWFEYTDRTGTHYCQPDLLLDLGDRIVILECKLTHTWAAHSQLKELYLPVVGKALGKRVKGVVVCKHVTKEPPKFVHSSLADALADTSYPIPVVQWLGHAPSLLAPHSAAA